MKPLSFVMSPAALDQGRTRRREYSSAPPKRLEHSVQQGLGGLKRSRAGGELLHHDGAQVRKRQRPGRKSDHVRLRFLASKAVDEDVGVPGAANR